MKECEKIYKYLDLARELIKLWNMKMMELPVGVGTLGTILKGVGEKRREELEIRGSIKTIQTTAFLISVRLIRRVLEVRGDLLSHRHP